MRHLLYHDLKQDREWKFELRVDGDTEHELHMHELLELNVLLENDARFQLSDRHYEGKPGDVFLFRPCEPHYNLAAEAGKPIRWLMALFSPSVVRLLPDGHRLLYPFYSGRVSPLIPASSAYARGIQASAKAACEEQERRLPGWEASQFKHLVDILVQVYRYALEKGKEASGAGTDVDDGVVAAVEYILRNVTGEIEMQRLIDLCGKGRTGFYAAFRQTVGLSPNRFIQRLRMQIAAHLLQTTSLPVTDIAFECGYRSLAYFNKHFKEHRGMSPREFRNRARADRATG